MTLHPLSAAVVGFLSQAVDTLNFIIIDKEWVTALGTVRLNVWSSFFFFISSCLLHKVTCGRCMKQEIGGDKEKKGWVFGQINTVKGSYFCLNVWSTVFELLREAQQAVKWKHSLLRKVDKWVKVIQGHFESCELYNSCHGFASLVVKFLFHPCKEYRILQQCPASHSYRWTLGATQYKHSLTGKPPPDAPLV